MTSADRRKLNKNAGFSLLELLIAVVILAIIVIPLFNLFLSSNKLNIRSRQTLRATTAAQDIMEGLKAYNIEEIKMQFADPASGFYVIDSRLIKGGVAEETALEVDPGLYVFSMKELNMQGSKFDAKIEVDGRGYMSSVPAGTAMKDHDAHLVSPLGTETYKFNDAALADARSIDKNNGTFVEAEKYRQAALKGAFKNSDMETAIKSRITAPNIDSAYMDLQDTTYFKNLTTLFDQVSRTITIDLSGSSEVDEDGRPKVDMEVTQVYTFVYKNASGTDVSVSVMGDSGSLIMVDGLSCGSITQTKDDKVNVNLFYYPLYGATTPDKIIINNTSGVAVNLLIAKQRHEKEDPSNPGVPDLSDPEYYSDPQLMAAEQTYRAEITINDTHFDADKFSLKTNLGLNLVGQKYMAGGSIELPAQFSVTGKNLNQLNIFTLDGVRSPLGKAGTPGEATELIYDVEVSVYEEGAAASGFPDDKRMVVIGGSMTN
ncbi:MAG: prepilin-type N-terminal cleavage/methylation domain-containing protein [Lachnospiraceae bacterium]|nr:prepilin-type N-terminal cleavage/methylation domain-containing protein [Lachnospiraceae bacterium]